MGDDLEEILAEVERRLAAYRAGRTAALERIATGDDPAPARASLAKIDGEIAENVRRQRELRRIIDAKCQLSGESADILRAGDPPRVPPDALAVRPQQQEE
jgi:hypothetical protein